MPSAFPPAAQFPELTASGGTRLAPEEDGIKVPQRAPEPSLWVEHLTASDQDSDSILDALVRLAAALRYLEFQCFNEQQNFDLGLHALCGIGQF